MELTKNAGRILNRYLKKDKNGRIIESPEQLLIRVAENISKEDKKYNQNPEISKKEFFQVMNNLEFLPNLPILANAGRELQQLAACFVIPIPDSIDGIFQSVKNMAIVQKSGGGTGFSFSNLRPEGSKVMETGGIASGPVSFMKVFDTATGAVKEGGIRRGANMGILRISHPDIEKFIKAKEKGGLKNFNISIAITDEFMQDVIKNKNFNLKFNNKIYKTIKARELFRLIAEEAWANGEPGVIFLDKINKNNPTPLLGKIEATNPCLAKDIWVLTKKGPAQIKELINKNISLALDGKFYNSAGFFKTGEKDVFKIITKEGYEIKASDNHLFLYAEKITRNKIYQNYKALKEIKKEDYLILGNNRKAIWSGKGSFEEGYLLGLLIGDGYFSENRGVISVWKKDIGSSSIIEKAERIARKIFKLRKDFKGFQKEINQRRDMKLNAIKCLASKFKLEKNKKISPDIEKTSYDFYRGFLKGFFDTDGSFQGNIKKGFSIRLWQNNLENLKIVQRMLQRLGIISSVYKRKDLEKKLMPDGKGGKKYYNSKEGYELIISKDNILIFAEKIGFYHSIKQNKLMAALKSYKRKLNKERFIVKIKEIIKLGKEEVFDINVPEINNFDANGFIVHNCGEQPLLPYESCILGSINLVKFEENKKILFDKLEKAIKIAVHFLDNSIDASSYPIKEIENIVKDNRKIGLGVMGFADLLIKLEIPYDSEEALKLAEKIMKFISEKARESSKELAEKRGSFPNIDKSVYKNQKLRNATLTTIAPTGILAIIADCSAGIEPLFNLIFKRNSTYGVFYEINPLFREIAEKYKIKKDILNRISSQENIKNIDIPDDIKRIFKTAHEISPEWHVKIQAAFQKYTDNAVSKTVNISENAKPKEIEKIYLLAFKLGCKGLTVYRYNSRKKQVLELCKKCK